MKKRRGEENRAGRKKLKKEGSREKGRKRKFSSLK